jgi:hypothetical protein
MNLNLFIINTFERIHPFELELQRFIKYIPDFDTCLLCGRESEYLIFNDGIRKYKSRLCKIHLNSKLKTQKHNLPFEELSRLKLKRSKQTLLQNMLHNKLNHKETKRIIQIYHRYVAMYMKIYYDLLNPENFKTFEIKDLNKNLYENLMYGNDNEHCTNEICKINDIKYPCFGHELCTSLILSYKKQQCLIFLDSDTTEHYILFKNNNNNNIFSEQFERDNDFIYKKSDKWEFPIDQVPMHLKMRPSLLSYIIIDCIYKYKQKKSDYDIFWNEHKFRKKVILFCLINHVYINLIITFANMYRVRVKEDSTWIYVDEEGKYYIRFYNARQLEKGEDIFTKGYFLNEYYHGTKKLPTELKTEYFSILREYFLENKCSDMLKELKNVD